MKYRNMISNQKISLLLFGCGGFLGLVLNMLGFGAITPDERYQLIQLLPMPHMAGTVAAFGVAGLLVGILTKRQGAALIYGISIGQCQFFLPLIVYFFILHSGTGWDALWRSLCGMPLTALTAMAGFALKQLFAKKKT